MIDAMTDGTPPRRCPKCAADLPATSEFFRPAPRLASGFRTACRACERAADAQWASDNSERRNARRRELRAADPEKVRAADARSYRLHRDRRLAAQAAWAGRNRAALSAYQREWRRKSKDLVSVAAAAAELGVGVGAVYAAVRAGRLSRYVRGGAVHVSREEVRDYRGRMPGGQAVRLRSLDAPLSGPGGGTFHEVRADDRAADPHEAAVAAEQARLLWGWAESCLTERQRRVLAAYVENDLDATQAARELGEHSHDVRRVIASVQARAARGGLPVSMRDA